MASYDYDNIDYEIDQLLESFFNNKKKKEKEQQERKEQEKKILDAKIKWSKEMLAKAYRERDKAYKEGYRYSRLRTEFTKDGNYFDLFLDVCKTTTPSDKDIKTIVLDRRVDEEYYFTVSYIKSAYARRE